MFSLEDKNHVLLNLFSKWCRCSEMTIKAFKCHLLGIYKKGTTSTQYKPKLYLDNVLVLPAKLNNCFTSCDRHFEFKMTDDQHRIGLIETVTEQIGIVYKLPFHPKNKNSISNGYYRKLADT